MKKTFQCASVRRVALTLFCAAATASAVPANAQYYGGIALNALRVTAIATGSDDIAGISPDAGFSTPVLAFRNARTLYGLKFSYPLGANLAIEGRYGELSRANFGAFSVPESFNSNAVMQRAASNYGLDLVATAPLFERASVYGRAGIQSLRTDNGFVAPTTMDWVAISPGQSSTAARVGIGIRYDFSNSLGLRLEAERFRKISGSALGELNLDNYSFGIQLKF